MFRPVEHSPREPRVEPPLRRCNTGEPRLSSPETANVMISAVCVPEPPWRASREGEAQFADRAGGGGKEQPLRGVLAATKGYNP